MNQSPATRSSRLRTDFADLDAIGGRGLFHDLEHGITTVRYLVDAVRSDPALPGACATRLDSAAIELHRLCEVVDGWLSDSPDATPERPVALRSMAAQLATLTMAEHDTVVDVVPGPDLAVAVNAAVAWRALSNVVDNAVRAAGPGGHVRIDVRRSTLTDETVIAVTDDGPGFGNAPGGLAGLGLRVTTSLLATCGGRLVRCDDSDGTTVELVFPSRLAVDVTDDVGRTVRAT